MSQIQLQSDHQNEIQWIRLLQIYVLHWRRKRENDVTCLICQQRVVELRLPTHPCLIPRPDPRRVIRCSTCSSFGQELEKLGRIGSLSCPFCQKRYESDVKAFGAHLSSHGIHERKNLVAFLNKPTNALFKVVLSPGDVVLNSIVKFLCSTFNRTKQFSRSTTICPLCLVQTPDLASHWLQHRIQRTQVSDSARAETIENFRHHCLTCHFSQLFSAILSYFNQLKLKAAKQNRAPLLRNANEIALDLEELQNRCRDPPYASCSYCAGFRAVFLHQLYNKGNQIVVESDRVLYSCSLLDGKWRSDAFESLNLLIRHMLYAHTDIKHTEPRLWRDDPIFIVTFMMKQSYSGGLASGSTVSKPYYHVFNQSLLKWCPFCFKPTQNWSFLSSHVAQEHCHIFSRYEPHTPQDALALGQIHYDNSVSTRKLTWASTVRMLSQLFAHLKNTHNSNYAPECPRCQFFATKLSNGPLVQKSGNPFYCIFCGIRVDRFDRTVVHIQTSHQTEIARQIHIQNNTTPKSLLQLNMDKVLITLGDLLTHKQSHPPLPCDICTSLSSQLANNSAFRSDDGRSFGCIFCPNHRNARFQEVIDHICENHSQNAVRLASAKRLERERREPPVEMSAKEIVSLIANSEDMGEVEFQVKTD